MWRSALERERDLRPAERVAEAPVCLRQSRTVVTWRGFIIAGVVKMFKFVI